MHFEGAASRKHLQERASRLWQARGRIQMPSALLWNGCKMPSYRPARHGLQPALSVDRSPIGMLIPITANQDMWFTVDSVGKVFRCTGAPLVHAQHAHLL